MADPAKALIVGDLHLGKSGSLAKPIVGSPINSRIIDQVNLLDWIYNLTLENEIKLIIFTGDIYEDAKPDYSLVRIFHAFLKKCDLENIEVHIVIGNHDIKRTGQTYTSVLDLIAVSNLAKCFVYKQIDTLIINNVSFTFMPFRDRRAYDTNSAAEALVLLEKELTDELAKIPNNCYKGLIGHLTLENALYVGDEIDDYINELICPISMFKGYDFVLQGHIHKPQIINENPHIAHTGSLDISDFGETNQQKIVIIFDPSIPNKLKEIPVPSRPLRLISISVPNKDKTTTYVIDYIKKFDQEKAIKEAIVKLEVKLELSDAQGLDRALIEKTIYDLGAHYLCNFSESRNISIIPLNKQSSVDNTITPKAAVKLYAEQIKFDTSDEKNQYITKALEIIDKVNSK